MKKKAYFSLLIIMMLSSSVFAQDYALGVRAGLRGFGVELYRSFGSQFNVHAGFSYFTMEVEAGDKETEDYTMLAKPKLTSLNLLADYMPFENFFRITGGLVINLNAIDTELTPTQTYTIGNDVYTPELLGTLDAKIKFVPVAPYIGIGFGNPTSGESGLSVTFDVGTFYQGAPQVDLSADGLLAPSASESQEETLESNLKWWQWYPVLNLGINYKF